MGGCWKKSVLFPGVQYWNDNQNLKSKFHEIQSKAVVIMWNYDVLSAWLCSDVRRPTSSASSVGSLEQEEKELEKEMQQKMNEVDAELHEEKAKIERKRWLGLNAINNSWDKALGELWNNRCSTIFDNISIYVYK